jgi:hypothetical protein
VSVVAESEVRYVAWTIQELETLLEQDPVVASKLQVRASLVRHY